MYKRSIELLLHTVTYVVLPGSVIRNSPHAEDPKRVGNRAGRLVWYGTCRFRLVPDMNWSVGPERTSRGIKWKKKGNKKESSLSLRNPKSVLKNDPAPSISLTSLSLNICWTYVSIWFWRLQSCSEEIWFRVSLELIWHCLWAALGGFGIYISDQFLIYKLGGDLRPDCCAHSKLCQEYFKPSWFFPINLQIFVLANK